MNLQQYSIKVIKHARQTGQFPDDRSFDLFHKLRHYFITSDYDKDKAEKRMYAAVMSKHDDILVLRDIFTENLFAIAWNMTGPKQLNEQSDISTFSRPTYSEFVTLILSRTYFEHFKEDNLEGDFKNMSDNDWSKEFVIAMSGSYAIHAAKAAHHRN